LSTNNGTNEFPFFNISDCFNSRPNSSVLQEAIVIASGGVYNYTSQQKAVISRLNVTSITIKSIGLKSEFRGVGLDLCFDASVAHIIDSIDAYPFKICPNGIAKLEDTFKIVNSVLREVQIDLPFIKSFEVIDSEITDKLSLAKFLTLEIIMENVNITNFILSTPTGCSKLDLYGVISTNVAFRTDCDQSTIRLSSFTQSSLDLSRSISVSIDESSFSNYMGGSDNPVLVLASAIPENYTISIINSIFADNGVDFEEPVYSSYYSTILFGNAFFDSANNASIVISGCSFINNTAILKNTTIFAPPFGRGSKKRLDWPNNSTLDFNTEPKTPTCFPGSDTLSKNDTCVLCDYGKYSPKGGVCQPCPAGNIAKLQGQDKCEPCRPGLFQNETGQGRCNSCPRWTIAPGLGSITCTLCGPGNYTIDNLKCTPCQAGSYQTPHDSDSALVCTSCQWFEGSKEGAVTCNFGSTVIYVVIAGGILIVAAVILIIVYCTCCRKKKRQGYMQVG